MKSTHAETLLFFTRMLSVVAISAAMIGIVFFNIPSDPDSYLAESVLQIELLKNIKGPRIIIFGGSNAAFGIDAALMQKELDIPVINDGLHAGLGIAPMKELQQYIQRGDVIILSLEYSFFSREETLYGHPEFLADWTEYSPSRIWYLPSSPADRAQHYHIFLQRKINRALDTYLHGGSLDETRAIYLAKNFDANGDFIGHLQGSPVDPERITSEAYPVTHLLDETYIFINEFKQNASEKGVTVYFEAPSSRETNCRVTGDANLMNFYTLLKEKTSIPVLTNLDMLCMPDEYFFDTEYHLTANGRKIRTLRLIENLIKMNHELSAR